LPPKSRRVSLRASDVQPCTPHTWRATRSQSRTLCIGMDVHKAAMAGAYGPPAPGAEATDLGSVGPRQGDRDQLGRHMPSKAKHLLCVSAAGPWGYGRYRSLTQKGYDCWGVAPSLMPQKPGDRITTDRRDAGPLARLARSGALPAVSVPPGAEAALRDRTRAREEAISALPDATVRLKACLLRPDIRSVGRANGGPAHLRWLADVVCPTPVQHIVLQDDVRAVSEPHERLHRLEPARQEPVTAWRLSPVVEALQALRGVPGPVAVPLGAAMGERPRFASPPELRKLLGLLPSEYASGAQRRQGASTQAGTTQARRVLGEGAGASRSPATVSRHVPLRLEKHPTVVQDIRGNAPGRRGKRPRRLGSRGHQATGVTVAMARALTGRMWARAQEGASVAADPDGS
jgi:transposase